MAIRYYDEAVWNKLQGWLRDPQLKILKPQETTRLFQLKSAMNDDKPIVLPLIALSRDPDITILSVTQKPLSNDGKHIANVNDKVAQLNAIPVQVSYQLDIYTKMYVEGDEYIRNFIFNIINHPALKIQIPYQGSTIEHICYMRIEPTVTDNSDIPEKLFADQFTRWTIRFRLDDAYLFSIPLRTAAEVIADDNSVITDKNNYNSVLEVRDELGDHIEEV